MDSTGKIFEFLKFCRQFVTKMNSIVRRTDVYPKSVFVMEEKIAEKEKTRIQKCA